MRVKIAVLASVFGLVSHPAFAAEDAAKAGAVEQKAPAQKAFSTGVAKGRDLLDSAISASTLDEVDLPKLGTASVVGIIGNLPGIRAETSGPDGFSAMTVRGLPMAADGSKFLQIQEDGLPVMEFGDVHFANVDMFVRSDLSLSQVQAIRGGSASTFASNSPGGVINLISKTGEQKGGSILATAGLNNDLNRVDFSYGGSLDSQWRFHVGGFYRQGEGPRNLGYSAYRGGQVKFNVTRSFDNGFIRFYGKFLDDRQPNYSLYPLMISGTNDKPQFASVPGTNMLRDAGNSQLVSTYAGVDRNNNPTTFNARNGMRGISKSVGMESQFEIAGWTFNEKFRYSANSGEYNESLPMLAMPASAVSTILGGPGSTISYANGANAGQSANMATLGGNGLLNLAIRINAQINSLNNVTNDLRASRVWALGEGKLTTTMGFYASSQDVGMAWTFTNTLESITGNAAASYINLASAGGTALTQNGVYAYGFGFGVPTPAYHNTFDVNYRVFAPYGSANYQIGRLAIGGSLRFDRGDVSGQILGADLGGSRVGTAAMDINRDGVISVAETKVAVTPLDQPGNVKYGYSYASYSAGVNYRISPTTSAFARYSRGARAAAERILFSPAQNSATGGLNNPRVAYSPVKQAEVGFKLRDKSYSLYLTGFWASTAENNLQIGADSTGQTIVLTIDRTYSAKGIELEGEVHHGPFSLALGATYVKAKIDKDVNDASVVGHTPRHQPKLFFQARPQFEQGKVTLGATINGTTSSFAQDTNVLKQPGYVIANPFVFYRPVPRIELGLQAYNVFNQLAIVQLGASAIPAGGMANAQVLNGRTVSGSLRVNF